MCVFVCVCVKWLGKKMSECMCVPGCVYVCVCVSLFVCVCV